MLPAPAIVSVPLVSPQVSWSSCDSGIGVATTSANIPLGVTTPQSIALSALLPMVLSSWHPCCPVGPSEQPAHVWFAPGLYSVCSMQPHSSLARPEGPEWGVCWDEGAACRQHLIQPTWGFLRPSSGLCPRVWEVPLLSSWVYCFAAYMEVLAPDPQTREMLAYCRLIIREALRHVRLYLSVSVDLFLPWHSLVPGLQAATILTPGHLGGSFEQFAASPITQQISVPFKLSSVERIVVVVDCHSKLMWIFASHGTKEGALFPARAHIGMYAPCVGGITGQSTALMPLLGLAPQSVQLGLNPLGRSTRWNYSLTGFVLLLCFFIFCLLLLFTFAIIGCFWPAPFCFSKLWFFQAIWSWGGGSFTEKKVVGQSHQIKCKIMSHQI